MNNKKMLVIAIAVVALIATMAGIFAMTRPETVAGGKTITVSVVHKDGTVVDFTCQTDEEYLGPVLLAEKIVDGEIGEFGLYFNTADGETADYSVDGGWWQIFIGDEAATTGADGIAITDGGIYKLVYTIG